MSNWGDIIYGCVLILIGFYVGLKVGYTQGWREGKGRNERPL